MNDPTKAVARRSRPGWWPSALTAATIVATGFVVPFAGPVNVARFCPGETRFALPFVFVTESLGAPDRTLVLGVLANTLVWAAVLLAVVQFVRLSPRLARAATVARDNQVGVLVIVVVAIAAVLWLGAGGPTASADIWPGHVDTPECGHVRGHTVRSNWWGDGRFELFDLARLGLGFG